MSNTATTLGDAALDRKLSINAGPFKGTNIPPQELRLYEESNEFGTKSYRAKWPHQARLARALDVFKIEDGYGITASVEDDPKDTTIQTRRMVNGVLTWTGPHPTQRHIAQLQRNGQILARATSLAALDVERAHESGENNALSRLLDHLGLPAYIHLTPAEYALLNQQQVPTDGEGDAGPPTPKATATPGARKGGAKVVAIAQPTPVSAKAPPPQGDDAAASDTPAAASTVADQGAEASEPATQAEAAPSAVTVVAAPSGDAAVTRNTRVRASNLWRRCRRGEPYPDPSTEAEALALIASLEREVKP